ncbi:MAG: hypothetical protein IT238_09775 [Bacteroidia bacterium]|nr:hypothetical protein [Bacteroidia bacterium]MCZ2249593.1 class I SAM-dependent methyltransferase [Bacteroidia bacterium]
MNIINQYTEQLINKDGIFFAKDQSEISYPKEGNENCNQIEQNSFWLNHRNNCINEAVKKYSPNNIFFGIGGGNSFVSKGLENAGITTVLVESVVQCVNVIKRGLSNLICSTLEVASFKTNSINSVGLFDVAEHIEDEYKFLKSINKFLTTIGFVYITVPAYNLLWSDEDTDTGHFRRYTLNSLKSVLNKSGFTIKYSTYIFSILPFPIFIARTLPSRLKFKRNSNSLTKHTNEPKNSQGLMGSITNKVWNYELNTLRKGKQIPFGGSCFVVAMKN